MTPSSNNPGAPGTPSGSGYPHKAQIKVDGKHWEIRAGDWVVSDLKAAVQVPADYELDQVVHDDLKPLADEDHVEVHGGDKFVSHIRQGGSS